MRKKKTNYILWRIVGVFLLATIIFALSHIQRPADYVFLLDSSESEEMGGYVTAFEEKLKQDGKTVKVLRLSGSSYTSLQQYQLLQEHIKKGTQCIVINAVTKSALSELLPTYREMGIRIISTLNEVNELQRDLHVGIADPVQLGMQMAADVKEITQGNGHFIVLLDSMQGSLSNDLVKGIRRTYEKMDAPGLYMDDILLASESREEVLDKFQDYLQETKEKLVALCLTEELTQIACEAVQKCGLEATVSIVGISESGNLESIKEKAKGESVKIYYYDDNTYGRNLAEIAEQVTEGNIECILGEQISLSDLTTCQITENINRTSDDPVGIETFLFADWQCFKSLNFQGI